MVFPYATLASELEVPCKDQMHTTSIPLYMRVIWGSVYIYIYRGYRGFMGAIYIIYLKVCNLGPRYSGSDSEGDGGVKSSMLT